MAKVLVVDDAQTIRALLQDVLTDAGYQVSLAVDGMDGLSHARSEHYDLVLTDVNMPRMDGYQLVSELRKLPPYRTVPIIALTTETSQSAIQRGREVNMTGWLTKPFDRVKLLTTLRRVLD